MLIVHFKRCQKWEIDLTCNIDHKTSTRYDQFFQDQQMEMTQKLEYEDQDQKHECDQSKHDLDTEHAQRLQQLKENERQVDECSTLFIVTRRGALLVTQRKLWVHFSVEQGVDSGAMANEFFTITLPNIGSVIFPNGQPVDSTFHVHDGNFKACGEIVAASIAQGGPAPCFLEESV